MKKFILIGIAVVVKILGSLILGFVFTSDFTSYTSYVSRTNDITVSFLLFLFFVDFLAIFIISNIVNVFFKELEQKNFLTLHQRIKKFILYSFVTIIVFWLSDVLFIVEVKKLTHWFLTGLLLLDKYIVALLIGISYTLKIYDLDKEESKKIFLDYQQFRFKGIISKYLFLHSRVFYHRLIAMSFYTLLVFYVNFISLYLYSNGLLLFLNVIICCIVLLYLLLITLHQLGIISGLYKSYADKQKPTSPVSLSEP